MFTIAFMRLRMEATAGISCDVTGKGRRNAAQPPCIDRFHQSHHPPCKARPAYRDE